MTPFALLLEAEIPRLRRYARALTRDVVRADDLVQGCLTRAIAKQHLWQPGTDLRAWLCTMLRNELISELRRSARNRETASIDDTITLSSVKPDAPYVLELRDLEAAIGKLPIEQREAILLIGLEGMRYEEAALVLRIPIGTLRSRLSRGRAMLRVLMNMDAKPRPIKSINAFQSKEKRVA